MKMTEAQKNYLGKKGEILEMFLRKIQLIYKIPIIDFPKRVNVVLDNQSYRDVFTVDGVAVVSFQDIISRGKLELKITFHNLEFFGGENEWI